MHNPWEHNEPTYCTAQQVVNWLRILDENGNVVTVGENSDPTKAEIDEKILDNEDILDMRLHYAYRERRVLHESHDIHPAYDWYWGSPAHFQYRSVKPIDPAMHDVVEVWNGESYDDITSQVYTSWRQDPHLGILYLVGYVFLFTRNNRLRVTYRYGDPSDTIPGWLKRCAIKMTACDMLETSMSMNKVQTMEGLNIEKRINRWRADVDEMVARMADMSVVEA